MLFPNVFQMLSCVALATSGAASDSIPNQQPAPVILSIGVEAGDSLYELSGVTSALRLSNGDIVVANSRSSQVRWYNSAGKFVRSIGRRGQGPNEFGGSLFLYQSVNDTIVALSRRRFHHIDRDGRFIHTDTLRESGALHWYYDRTIIERAPFGLQDARLRMVAAGIPKSTGEFGRRAIPDAAGNLWISGDTAGHTWRGYGAAGREIGSLSLQGNFEIFQILDTLVLGLHRDSLGVERVQLRRIPRAAPRAGSTVSPNARSAYDPAVERKAHEDLFKSMLTALRNSVTAQEVHFAEKRTYASSVDALLVRPSGGVVLTVVKASETGFWMTASHPSIRSTCVFAVGNDWAMGYVEACG